MQKLVVVPNERIVSRIFLIRNKKVMIDRDLAKLYGVSTKVFNQAVKRHKKRFPCDFMFQLSKKEFQNWRSQFVTSKEDIMGLRRRSYVFTEQGVAMLSSVLNSERAIKVNIQIIRTFVKLRELVATNKRLQGKIEALEKKYDKKLKIIFEVIRRLVVEENKPKEEIGFEVKR